MKANRKFLNRSDEGVSPVIAVILMVAITVVLAATVYVWVSGFGNSSSAPAKSLSLTSAGQESRTNASGDTDWEKRYTVASASTGLTYQDMSLQLAGATVPFSAGNDATAPASCRTALLDYDDNGFTCSTSGADKIAWGVLRGGTPQPGTAAVRAGDVIVLEQDDDTLAASSFFPGKTLQILDPNANSIMLTLTIAS